MGLAGGLAVAAGASAVGGIITSGNSASAAKSAANTQSEAARYAADLQMQQFNQIEGNLAPYRGFGNAALQALGYGLGLPGYGAPGSGGGSNGGGGSSVGGMASGGGGAFNYGQGDGTTLANGEQGTLGASGPNAITGGGLPQGWSIVPGTAVQSGDQTNQTPTTVRDNAGNIIQSFANTTPTSQIISDLGNMGVFGGNSGDGSRTGGADYGGVAGSGASDPGAGWLMGGSAPTWDPTMEGLEKTPGYQFALDQGLKATANKNAGLGLGGSGAEVKAAQGYATGLASNTYQQQFSNFQTQFQNYWTSLMNKYGMLSNAAGVGQNAAVQTGQAGQQAVTAAGNNLTSAAAANAAGTVGAANAANSGINAITGGIGTGLMSYGLQNSGLFGNSGGVEDGAFV